MSKFNDTRRGFLRAAGLGAAAVSMPNLLSAAAVPKRPPRQAQGKPNILFIMSDDHAAPAMSCYGSRINKTPNLDRIAAGGMRLTNCFCTNSICTPSRAVIMTGKHSHKNGVFTLSDRLDERQQTFTRLLQKAGYHTGVVGKWHLKTPPSAFGFDRWDVLPGQGAYFNPLMLRKEARRKHTGYVTDVITDLALDFLKDRAKDRPFCLLYHHKAPHDNFEYDDKHAHLYEDVDIPEPGNLYDDYENRAEAVRRVTQKIGMRHTSYTRQTRNLPPGERKKRQYQIYIKSYLRCVASIDDNVGRVLDYLDAEGLTKDTVVVYTSDQGFFLGEHGMYDKRFMYEESLRVPLIVRYPREIKAGGVSDALAQNVDFAETFLDYAGVAIPKEMQGRSLRGVLAGRTPDDWRSSVYYRYWMHGAHFNVAAHYGVRTKRYKLIFYYGLPLGKRGCTKNAHKPEWELFDLKSDPHEMKNVYADPACAGVVKELKAELLRLKKELGDEDEAYPALMKVRRQAW